MIPGATVRESGAVVQKPVLEPSRRSRSAVRSPSKGREPSVSPPTFPGEADWPDNCSGKAPERQEDVQLARLALEQARRAGFSPEVLKLLEDELVAKKKKAADARPLGWKRQQANWRVKTSISDYERSKEAVKKQAELVEKAKEELAARHETASKKYAAVRAAYVEQATLVLETAALQAMRLETVTPQQLSVARLKVDKCIEAVSMSAGEGEDQMLQDLAAASQELSTKVKDSRQLGSATRQELEAASPISGYSSSESSEEHKGRRRSSSSPPAPAGPIASEAPTQEYGADVKGDLGVKMETEGEQRAVAGIKRLAERAEAGNTVTAEDLQVVLQEAQAQAKRCKQP